MRVLPFQGEEIPDFSQMLDRISLQSETLFQAIAYIYA